MPIVIKQRDDSKIRSTKAVVIRECGAEASGANDADAMRAVEPENLRDVIAQIVDIVTDAAHAKLAEVTQIFPNLGGVQIKLCGQRLRRDGLDPGFVERVQAAK